MRSSTSDPEWNPAHAQCPLPGRDRSLLDLVLITVGVLVFFVLSVQLELAESLAHWTQLYERWQLDELPLTLLVLSLGLVWFGWRRWRELNREMQMRSLVEASNQRMLEQNRRLAQQLIHLQESERRHIARELHDDVGQCGVAIKVDAALIAREASPANASVQAGAQRISDTADHLQRALRGILNRLRPTGLDDLGLVSSLELLVDSWQARHGIACAFSVSGVLDGLDEASTITLYRSVQESLTNIARHAHSSQASVALAHTVLAPGEDRVVLTVRDNGVGLPSGGTHQGLGVLGMRERVSALGGQMALTLLPTGGTQLQVLLPLTAGGAMA